MTEVRTIIFVFAWIFTVALVFLAFNTFIIGNVVPLLDDVADNLTYVDQDRYTTVRNANVAFFYILFAIMFILPFVYLIARLFLRREPGPQGGFANAVSI